jgi:hypothetical protein
MRRHASEGIRIEASILARLLRIKLLKLDASILVFPTEVTPPPPAPPDLVVRTSPLPKVEPAASADNGRRTLADAVRSIHEGAELLAEARRGRS